MVIYHCRMFNATKPGLPAISALLLFHICISKHFDGYGSNYKNSLNSKPFLYNY